ncbi:hypothetical protein FRC05_002476 [Tulasnella sp. 425]|nr:hypothetical protein FRC05_002476 [Tulasnella sp. 425]
MNTVPNARMLSVGDLARGSSKRASSDMPFYKTASIYNPTYISSGTNLGRPSCDSQSGSGRKISPFADKFALEGKEEPDSDDPAVMASFASAHTPRQPHPPRLKGLALEEASGPMHLRRRPAHCRLTITGTRSPRPRRLVKPGRLADLFSSRCPSLLRCEIRQQRSLDTLPSWALVNSDGRPPAITVDVQTSSTARTVSSPTGMAGGGAGRPSLKDKKVSIQEGHVSYGDPSSEGSIPPTVPSPPSAMRVQSPNAVVDEEHDEWIFSFAFVLSWLDCHKLKGSGSSVASHGRTIVNAKDSTVGPVPPTAAISAHSNIELNGPTPVVSPQVKGRTLQLPRPISTGLNPASSSYASVHLPQIPTPLASPWIGSPTTLAQFGQAKLPGGGWITRVNSVKTTSTRYSVSEGAHTVLRRELM